MNETRYRRPLIGMAPAAFICLIFLLSPDPTLRWLAFVIVVLSALMYLRQGLVVTAEGVEVTLIRTQRIPWSQVRGFERGSGLRGGMRVLTPSGKVWSPAPSSWWGGPATAEQISEVAAARPTRKRAKGR